MVGRSLDGQPKDQCVAREGEEAETTNKLSGIIIVSMRLSFEIEMNLL